MLPVVLTTFLQNITDVHGTHMEKIFKKQGQVANPTPFFGNRKSKEWQIRATDRLYRVL